MGFKAFLYSFRDTGDNVYFLRYPYTNAEAKHAFEALGIDVDMGEFSLRERKRKWGRRKPEVQKFLDVYSDFEFGDD